jgi:hypothetical protein
VSSFISEKCSVLTPRVEGSEPLTLTGRSSARRKPFWTFVGEGAKIEASLLGVCQLWQKVENRPEYLRVTSTALKQFLSNCTIPFSSGDLEFYLGFITYK